MKTAARVCTGIFAFAFLLIGCNETGAVRVDSFIACGLCAIVFLLLKIPTKGDMRRKQAKRERSRERMARLEAERARATGHLPKLTRMTARGVCGVLAWTLLTKYPESLRPLPLWAASCS